MSKEHHPENKGRGVLFLEYSQYLHPVPAHDHRENDMAGREGKKKARHRETMTDAVMVHPLVTDRVDSSSWLEVKRASCLFYLFRVTTVLLWHSSHTHTLMIL